MFIHSPPIIKSSGRVLKQSVFINGTEFVIQLILYLDSGEFVGEAR